MTCVFDKSRQYNTLRIFFSTIAWKIVTCLALCLLKRYYRVTSKLQSKLLILTPGVRIDLYENVIKRLSNGTRNKADSKRKETLFI